MLDILFRIFFCCAQIFLAYYKVIYFLLPGLHCCDDKITLTPLVVSFKFILYLPFPPFSNPLIYGTDAPCYPRNTVHFVSTRGLF